MSKHQQRNFILRPKSVLSLFKPVLGSINSQSLEHVKPGTKIHQQKFYKINFVKIHVEKTIHFGKIHFGNRNLKAVSHSFQKVVSRPVVPGHSESVRDTNTVKVCRTYVPTNLPTYLLTGLGSRDVYAKLCLIIKMKTTRTTVSR